MSFFWFCKNTHPNILTQQQTKKNKFRENHDDNGQNRTEFGRDKLLKEAENFRNEIRAQQKGKEAGNGNGNVLPEKASYLKKIAEIHLVLRKTLHGHLSKGEE